MYKFEMYLTRKFKTTLTKEGGFKISHVASEFNYVNGKVDIVAVNGSGDLFAFEAKLTRWRQALYQAYRNSAFAHYSYVVIPSSITKNALRGKYEFEKRGIGLCSVGPSGVQVEISAPKNNPLQPWLTGRAMNYAMK